VLGAVKAASLRSAGAFRAAGLDRACAQRHTRAIARWPRRAVTFERPLTGVTLLPMRVPSRLMPKAVRRASLPVLVFAWTVLLAFVATYGYELWTPPVIVLAGSCLLAVIVARNKRRTKRHLTELARARAGESICEFSRSFDTRKTDTWVIRAVYEQLQLQLRWICPDFPVRATDRLIEDLWLDPDDIDLDLLADVSSRTRRSIRDTSSNPFRGGVKTVGDLVAFLCAQPSER